MTAPDARPGRRRTVIVGACLAVLAAAVIVVVVVLSTTGDNDKVDSPTAAAQAWINAHLHHDTAAFDRLSCTGAAQKAATFDLTAAGVRSVTAEHAARQPDGTWTVDLAVTGPSGPDGTFPVTVHRVDDGYRVC